MHPLLGPVLYVHVVFTREPFVLDMDTSQAGYGSEKAAGIVVGNWTLVHEHGVDIKLVKLQKF